MAVKLSHHADSLRTRPHAAVGRSIAIDATPQRSALNWDDSRSSQFATQEKIHGERKGDRHEKHEHIGQRETTASSDVLFVDFQTPVTLPQNQQEPEDEYQENPTILG